MKVVVLAKKEISERPVYVPRFLLVNFSTNHSKKDRINRDLLCETEKAVMVDCLV